MCVCKTKREGERQSERARERARETERLCVTVWYVCVCLFVCVGEREN